MVTLRYKIMNKTLVHIGVAPAPNVVADLSPIQDGETPPSPGGS